MSTRDPRVEPRFGDRLRQKGSGARINVTFTAGWDVCYHSSAAGDREVEIDRWRHLMRGAVVECVAEVSDE